MQFKRMLYLIPQGDGSRATGTASALNAGPSGGSVVTASPANDTADAVGAYALGMGGCDDTRNNALFDHVRNCRIYEAITNYTVYVTLRLHLLYNCTSN